jgi:hypothetical protein
MPRGFTLRISPRLLDELSMTAPDMWMPTPLAYTGTPHGLLKRGATLEAAKRELQAIANTVRIRNSPDTLRPFAGGGGGGAGGGAGAGGGGSFRIFIVGAARSHEQSDCPRRGWCWRRRRFRGDWRVRRPGRRWWVGRRFCTDAGGRGGNGGTGGTGPGGGGIEARVSASIPRASERWPTAQQQQHNKRRSRRYGRLGPSFAG